MSKKNTGRMLLLLLLAVLISSSVFILDAFRDDDFCRYDAPFYSTISQNIVRTGDWINLRHSFDTPFEGDHPPLVFWATALSFKFFGESVFTAALFGLLCATGACIAVFFIGTLLRNDITGFFSAMGLLLTRYVVRVSRYNTIEIPLMFFVALAILFLVLALNRNRFFYVLFGFSVALAILAKGVVGFFPFGICLLAMIIQRRALDVFHPFFLLGALIAFGIPGAWLFIKGGMSLEGMWTALKPYMIFVVNTFEGAGREDPGSRLRFITKLGEGCFIILPGVALGIFFTIRDGIKEKRRDLYVILIWAVVFIAAYLLSSWRRGFYLLPMYPAMALLFGIGLHDVLRENHRMNTIYLLTAFFAGNIAAPFLFPHWEYKNVDEALFGDVYFPEVRKAARVICSQSPQKVRFVAYQLSFPEEKEFIFFFRSDHDIEFCRSDEEFRELVNSGEPVLFYITKENFSRMDKELQLKLKIVYVFDDKILATNNTQIVPVFDAAKR